MPARPHDTPRRTTGSLRGPIVLNAVLLLLLGAVTFAPEAAAQLRRRGEYTMVVGGVNNSISSVVYIADSVNQEMVVMRYDSATRTLQGVTYRDLAADAADLMRGRAHTGN